jgi:hypothetical protein
MKKQRKVVPMDNIDEDIKLIKYKAYKIRDINFS